MTKSHFSPFLHFIFTKATQIRGKLTFITRYMGKPYETAPKERVMSGCPEGKPYEIQDNFERSLDFMEGFDNREGYQNPSAFDNQEGYDDAPAHNNQEGYNDAPSYNSQEGYESPSAFEPETAADDVTDGYSYGETNDFDTRNTYGNGDETNGWYRPCEEPQKPAKEKRGLGGRLVKLAAMALVFGIVAGAAFAGTIQFFGAVTGSEDLTEGKEKVPSGADFNIAGGTEAGDPISNSIQDNKAQAKEGAVTDVSDIVNQAMPSIVSITTIARTQMRGFFFGETQEYKSEGCGSGIIISQDEENLYIATNNHVIEGAETLTVLFADNATVDARVKGTDASSDLAVVSVALEDIEEETKERIRVAAFGDSSLLKIGQTAIAIGNALGYGQSVTTGVISALDREVTVTNETDGSTITNELLQTSAAINPGNSGGALLSIDGEVIGITSVKYSETSVEGMGYAIPTETALPIIRQLITREVVTGSDTAYLGISGVDVTQNVSDTYQMPQGVYIAQIVEGSSAANAGLMQGDIITRFDGRNIKSMAEMQELMKYLSAGTTVEVTIQRAQNGEFIEQTIDVVLGSKN